MAESDRERRMRLRAENTLVADLVDRNGEPAGTIVLAHPGQDLDRDAEHLMKNFGVTPDMVIPLSESRERPLTDDEKISERARAEVDAELEAEARAERLRIARDTASRAAASTARRGAANTAKPGPEPVSAS